MLAKKKTGMRWTYAMSCVTVSPAWEDRAWTVKFPGVVHGMICRGASPYCQRQHASPQHFGKLCQTPGIPFQSLPATTGGLFVLPLSDIYLIFKSSADSE